MQATKSRTSAPVLVEQAKYKTLKIRLREVERVRIEGMALRYGMSKNRYIQRCLEDKEQTLAIIPEMYPTGHGTSLTFRLPTALVERTARAAKKARLRSVAEYIRRRAVDGLHGKAPTILGLAKDGQLARRLREAGIPGRRGRPRNEEYILAAAGGDLLKAMCMDPAKMRMALEDIFKLLGRAGVRPGDVMAMFEVLKRVVRVDEVRVPTGPPSSDPNTSQATRVVTRVVVWTGDGGLVEALEPPAETRAAGATKRFLGGSGNAEMKVGG